MRHNTVLFKTYARRLLDLKDSVEGIVSAGYSNGRREKEIMDLLLEIEAEAVGIQDCVKVLKHLDRG